MPKFIMLNARAVERQRRIRERDRLRSANKRYQYPGYDHRARDKRRRNADFIMWDGESPKDAGYAFFANSKGKFILKPHLSTLECLELIYETECEYPDAIHIGFGFNYDVSMMLKDLPKAQLTALHHTCHTIWEDWQIEHIPGKWVRIKRGKVIAKIFDIHSFFSGAYVPALQQFNVGSIADRAKLAQEKARRGEFLWQDIDEIADYCRLELKLGPELAGQLRTALDLASYVPRSWHGPGAVARMAFQRHDVYSAMAKCPTEVRTAARFAFAGGRFNQFKVGWIQGDVYEADINSAYPYYATMLPNLAKGKWRHVKKFEAGKFGVYHIRYAAKPEGKRVYPLFRRMSDHRGVAWPHRVEGWYWNPEAELVKDDPDATFVEGLVFDELDETDRPFAFLADYYDRRKLADSIGSIVAYAFKIIINAIYGQLAQRAGWDRKKRKPPRTHQLEWAGFITSGCRAAVYKAAVAAKDNLISINTDSIQTTCPLDDIVDSGSALGQWKVKRYSDGVMWQAGIYFLREDLGYDEALGYGWSKAKTRGIPYGSYTPEDLIDAMKNGVEELRLTKHSFIPYTLADNGMWGKLNAWVDQECVYSFGGKGFLSHRGRVGTRYCRANCSGTVHRTMLNSVTYLNFDDPEEMWSKPHYLPWIDGPDPIRMMMDDILAWGMNNLDESNDWMLDCQVAG